MTMYPFVPICTQPALVDKAKGDCNVSPSWNWVVHIFHSAYVLRLYPFYKGWIWGLIVLACASLACLQTVTPAKSMAGTVAPVATLTNVPPIVATRFSPAEPTLTNVTRCAQEVAPSAENLRIDANPDAQVITWLENGDVVKVISESNLNWWLVESGAHVGYARSLYLKIVSCGKVKP